MKNLFRKHREVKKLSYGQGIEKRLKLFKIEESFL